jgi:carbamoyltransferase
MKILGIHIGHDSGAALVKDGVIVADVSEERFAGIKHYAGLPIQSIDYCLKAGNLAINNIEIVAVPSKASFPELNFLLNLPKNKREESGSKRIMEYALRLTDKKSITAIPPIYIKNYSLNSKTNVLHVEHHLAHAASAYYTSGAKANENWLIVTCDGLGDGFSLCILRGKNNKIEPLVKYDREASIGWFYSNVTEALGWWHGDGEGKTMGLAPYGNFEKCRGVLDKYYPKFENGKLLEKHNYGKVHFWNEGGAFQWHLAESSEILALINKYGRENIAAEAQRILEKQMLHIILPWLTKEKTSNLACAGGVFLNVKLNQRVWESGKVKKHHIFPNAGDSGLAVGAALYAYYANKESQENRLIEHLYLGPEYSDNEIEETLKMCNLIYKKTDNPSEVAAKFLAEGKIIGWVQGRMESGPRALGNRSILMSADKSKNKDIINAKVKFREPFRPFCPSLLYEKKDEYLKNGREEPFMITSFDVTDNKKNNIPAVVHVDNTLRPQTVRKEINSNYWNLINDFGNITGEYLVLNTSFNIKGQPIVNSPLDAIRCFFGTGMDVLILGSYVLTKDR